MVSCVKCEKRDWVLRDKSPILRRGLAHYRLGKSLRPRLESGDFSSQSVASLEILESQSGFTETAHKVESTFESPTAIPRILEEEKQAENKKTTDIQKVDSSKQAHFLSLRALRSKAWQSIQTKTQNLESTFSHNTQKLQKLQKVDSRIFHNTAIFATAKKMDCHDFANAKSRNDGNRVFDTTPQDEKTESVFDKKSQAEGFSKETSACAERYPLFSRRGRRDLP